MLPTLERLVHFTELDMYTARWQTIIPEIQAPSSNAPILWLTGLTSRVICLKKIYSDLSKKNLLLPDERCRVSSVQLNLIDHKLSTTGFVVHCTDVA